VPEAAVRYSGEMDVLRTIFLDEIV